MGKEKERKNTSEGKKKRKKIRAFATLSFNKQLAQMGKIKTFSHSQPAGVCS